MEAWPPGPVPGVRSKTEVHIERLEPTPNPNRANAYPPHGGKRPLVGSRLYQQIPSGPLRQLAGRYRPGQRGPIHRRHRSSVWTPTKNPHLPPYKETASVVYTGTHDNDTTIGWYDALRPAIRDRFDRVTKSTSPCTDPSGALMRLAWTSSAEWAIAPLQDVLRLGSFARMNTPGQERGNWRWRARRLPATAAAELAEINQSSGRSEGHRI